MGAGYKTLGGGYIDYIYEPNYELEINKIESDIALESAKRKAMQDTRFNFLETFPEMQDISNEYINEFQGVVDDFLPSFLERPNDPETIRQLAKIKNQGKNLFFDGEPMKMHKAYKARQQQKEEQKEYIKGLEKDSDKQAETIRMFEYDQYFRNKVKEQAKKGTIDGFNPSPMAHHVNINNFLKENIDVEALKESKDAYKRNEYFISHNGKPLFASQWANAGLRVEDGNTVIDEEGKTYEIQGNNEIVMKRLFPFQYSYFKEKESGYNSEAIRGLARANLMDNGAYLRMISQDYHDFGRGRVDEVTRERETEEEYRNRRLNNDVLKFAGQYNKVTDVSEEMSTITDDYGKQVSLAHLRSRLRKDEAKYKKNLEEEENTLRIFSSQDFNMYDEEELLSGRAYTNLKGKEVMGTLTEEEKIELHNMDVMMNQAMDAAGITNEKLRDAILSSRSIESPMERMSQNQGSNIYTEEEYAIIRQDNEVLEQHKDEVDEYRKNLIKMNKVQVPFLPIPTLEEGKDMSEQDIIVRGINEEITQGINNGNIGIYAPGQMPTDKDGNLIEGEEGISVEGYSISGYNNVLEKMMRENNISNAAELFVPGSIERTEIDGVPIYTAILRQDVLNKQNSLGFNWFMNDNLQNASGQTIGNKITFSVEGVSSNLGDIILEKITPNTPEEVTAELEHMVMYTGIGGKNPNAKEFRSASTSGKRAMAAYRRLSLDYTENNKTFPQNFYLDDFTGYGGKNYKIKSDNNMDGLFFIEDEKGETIIEQIETREELKEAIYILKTREIVEDEN